MLSKLVFSVLCLLTAAQCLSQNITDSLVAHYSFCDCTATDVSGNGRDGTIAGSPQCVDGNMGKGLLLNQNGDTDPECGILGGDHVKLPALDAIWSKGITVSAWVKFDFENFYERIVDFSNGVIGDIDGVVFWFGREEYTNGLAVESWINETASEARSTGKLIAPDVIVNGVLQHYSVTIHEDTMRLYVNGAMVAEKKGHPIRNVPRSSNYIGKSTWCGYDPDLSGFIDEVRIYNRGLSAEEIMMIYTNTEKKDFDVQVSCSSEAAFSFPPNKAVDSVRWHFDDAASGAYNTALGNDVSHNFTAPGTYSVRAIAYRYCANDTITQDVTIDNVMHLSASVATNDNNACAGEEMVFAATTNATDPSYQWQVNGVDAGNNSAVFSSNTLNSNDEVSCIITTSDACAGSVVSNSITVLIAPAVTPQVTISASVTDICQGEEITLTATATHGGSAPVFQWQVNGLNAGNNSSSFSGNTFNSNDAVSCILTSNASCINKSKDTSDMVIIHVTTPVTPSIEITTTSAAACQNETILFNSTIQHGGSAPQYQWQVNEVNAGTAPTFSSTALNDGDVIRCILTSNIACITRVTDTSDAVTIAISEAITPQLSISASSASICTGATVAFNAIAENAGSAPAYQWYINDVAVNETGQQFSGSNFSDGDVIKCIVTSNAACAAPTNTAADELALSVSDVVTSVTQKLICEGENYWGYTTPGTYTDQFVSAAGCDSIRTLYLEVGLNPVPSLGNDTSICAGEALQLSPGQFSSYLWQNGSTQSSITATAAGTYTVTVTNECGSSTATITIAEKACGDIWFPSAFTPNGDNINDRFGVLNAGILESYYLAVYNRWGEKIFETTNPARAWDGKTKGTASPTGIYTWYSVFKKSGQVYQKKGYVTIIR